MTIGIFIIGGLMWGGAFGLPYVENERWGGLILTLLLSTFGVAFAFPLSILLALFVAGAQVGHSGGNLVYRDGAASAWTRNGKDWSDKFRALVKAAETLPPGCLIDGEAVALNAKGKPDFQLLQSTLKEQKGANLAFYAFDLLVDRGEDIRKLPNLERKERLEALLGTAEPPVTVAEHVIGAGEKLVQGRFLDAEVDGAVPTAAFNITVLSHLLGRRIPRPLPAHRQRVDRPSGF